MAMGFFCIAALLCTVIYAAPPGDGECPGGLADETVFLQMGRALKHGSDRVREREEDAVNVNDRSNELIGKDLERSSPVNDATFFRCGEFKAKISCGCDGCHLSRRSLEYAKAGRQEQARKLDVLAERVKAGADPCLRRAPEVREIWVAKNKLGEALLQWGEEIGGNLPASRVHAQLRNMDREGSAEDPNGGSCFSACISACVVNCMPACMRKCLPHEARDGGSNEGSDEGIDEEGRRETMRQAMRLVHAHHQEPEQYQNFEITLDNTDRREIIDSIDTHIAATNPGPQDEETFEFDELAEVSARKYDNPSDAFTITTPNMVLFSDLLTNCPVAELKSLVDTVGRAPLRSDGLPWE